MTMESSVMDNSPIRNDLTSGLNKKEKNLLNNIEKAKLEAYANDNNACSSSEGFV